MRIRSGYGNEWTCDLVLLSGVQACDLDLLCCQVYERLDWRDMVISRSTRAQCGRFQTARSSRPEEGASLFLELKESERLC